MPIHDWTRVDAGIFHDFHVTWIAELKRALNAGLLPPDYYALAEQIAGSIGPDVITLQQPEAVGNGTPGDLQGTIAVLTKPPKVKLTLRAELDDYVLKRRTIVIRHISKHRIVALIEILSPGNKSSRPAIKALLGKIESALSQGIHLLIVDLFPPTRRDPEGIHGLIWKRIIGMPCKRPRNKPLTLAAYVARPPMTAYVEPIAIGEALPPMPVFLDAEQYINVPLEPTYDSAYASIPQFYRRILEPPSE